MSEVRLYLFGSPHFEVDGQPLKLELRKSMALVAYLAVQREAFQRETLINLLWPEEEASRGRSLLRHVLSPLRKSLPDGWLAADRESIGLQPVMPMWVDVLEFRKLASSSSEHGHPDGEVCPTCGMQLTQAVELYQDDFMAGFTLPDSPAFDEWQYFQAEGLRRALEGVLKRLAQCLILAGNLDAAIQTERRRLVLDILNEEAHCDLMRLYAWNHQRSRALRQYRDCAKTLQDQLGIDPQKTTLDLMQAIESGQIPIRPAHPAWQPAFPQNPSPPSPGIPHADNLPELVEALTPRELDILRLLAEKLSDREIADRLVLALNSVKWYTHQIYAKLAVENRRQAVAKAQELKLLEFNSKANPRLHSLPRQLTSFIGRDKEIMDVMELAVKYPLVTLTGSGGTGKTRLALRAAEELRDAFPDGIGLIELASLADPGLVLQTVVTALGLAEKPGKTPIQLLVDFLRPKRLLLILDNCEHLLKACAELAAELLHSAPRLTILATSREILGVGGEFPFRVPPLAMPDPRRLPPLDTLANIDAVRLFVERARFVYPGFTLSEENAAEVAQITQRLDGIPLAIELAAARLRLLSVKQIALRLDDVFSLLTGGSRTALSRHQTLKALIDWSYHLLSEKEQRLFLRLSVFAGGWNLEAAEAVCSSGGLESDPILDLLGQLVDKSLAQTVRSADGLSRYRMLETVRQYAHDRLVEEGGDQAMHEKHLDYFLTLSLEAEPHLHSRDQVIWSDRLLQEMDNMRQAMAWSLGGKLIEGMTLAALFSMAPGIRESEGIEWCEKMLEAEAALPESGATDAEPGGSFTRSLARARLLRISGTGSIGFYQAYSKQDFDRMEESIAICRRLGPGARKDLSLALLFMSSLKADLDQAAATVQEGLDLARQLGDSYLIADLLFATAFHAYKRGNLKQMRDDMAECLGLGREIGNQHGIASCLFNLGYLACLEGEYQQALDFLVEGAGLFRAVGDEGFLSVTFLNLSMLERAKGDYQAATHWGEEALSLARKNDFKDFIVSFLCNLGLIAWGAEKYDLAAALGKEALALAQASGYGTSVAQHLLGRVALSRGDLPAASTFLNQMLMVNTPVIWSGLGFTNPPETAYLLESLAVLAAAQGVIKRAAILCGAIREWESQIEGIYCPRERSEHQAALDAARRVLGEEAFEAAWKEGQALTMEQARAYALEGLSK